MRRRWLFVVALVGASSALAMCRDATQMFVEVTTDLSCDKHGGTSIIVGTLADLGLKTGAPTSFATTCNNGKIGTLVIIPRGSDDEDVAFQITTGISVDPTVKCGDPTSTSCITARRSLHFLPHESLRIHVPMNQICAGVKCDPTQTCANGKCVDATIDPSRCTGGGCGEDALGGGTGASDGGSDAIALDAAAVAPNEVAIGEDHTCAVVDGSVYCWGSNEIGQTGTGSPAADAAVTTPTLVTGLPPIKSVATGSNTTGALTRDGAVYVWGENASAQAPGKTGVVATPALVDVRILDQLAVGPNHVCGIVPGGKALSCWGAAADLSGADLPPTDIDLGGSVAVQIGLGNQLTVVRIADGTVRTAGQATDVSFGLGRPDASTGTTPIAVPSVVGAVDVAVGWYDVFATLAPSGLLVWGTNQGGDLGHDFVHHDAPVPYPQVAKLSSFALGNLFACAIDGNKVKCWGRSPFGQLGPGIGVNGTPDPVEVALPAPATKVWAGPNHVCARAGGKLYCWGANDFGQLGSGTRNPTAPASAIGQATPQLVQLP